jgi:hypothetical protein
MPTQVWTRKAGGPSSLSLADKGQTVHNLLNTASPQLELLSWDMSGARKFLQPSAPTALTVLPPLHPSPRNAFKMHTLLAALSGPDVS